MVKIAFEFFSPDLDDGLIIVILDQRSLGAVQPELMQHRPHLRRKGKIGGRIVMIEYDDAHFVDDIVFIDALQHRARETVRNDLWRI
jgi:hypothetical protein